MRVALAETPPRSGACRSVRKRIRGTCQDTMGGMMDLESVQHRRFSRLKTHGLPKSVPMSRDAAEKSLRATLLEHPPLTCPGREIPAAPRIAGPRRRARR